MIRMNTHQVKFNPVVDNIKIEDYSEKEEDLKSNLQSENKKMLTVNSIKRNNRRLNTNNSDGKNDVYIYTNHSQNNESPSKKNLDNNNGDKLSKRNSTKTKRTTRENFEISELQKKIRVKFIKKI